MDLFETNKGYALMESIARSLDSIAGSLRAMQAGKKEETDEDKIYRKVTNEFLLADVAARMRDAEAGGDDIVGVRALKNMERMSEKEKEQLVRDNLMRFRAALDSNDVISEARWETIDQCLNDIFRDYKKPGSKKSLPADLFD